MKDNGWIRSRLTLVAIVLCTTLCDAAWGGDVPAKRAEHASAALPTITEWEASLLLYVLPPAHRIRSVGKDVQWFADPYHPEANYDLYFIFWLKAEPSPDTASDSLGWYAVNRFTGDVWDFTSDERVTDREVEGVARILRKAHGIEEKQIKKYRSIPPR